MKRESYINISKPPLLQSPPPMDSPIASNKSYRWTSMTAANSAKIGLENSHKQRPQPTTPCTPERRKADTTWWSPSHGDTWRKNPPRGRIHNIAKMFDDIGKQDVLDFNNYEIVNSKNFSRIRRNSEPNHENEEKEIVQPNFIDDSMIEDPNVNEDQDEEEKFVEVDADFYERQTVMYRRESEEVESNKQNEWNNVQGENTNESRQSTLSSTHRTTLNHVIKDNGDHQFSNNYHQTNIIDLTPKRPTTLSPRCSVPNFNLDRELNERKDMKEKSVITSTPYSQKYDKDDLGKYFGHEESIRASPLLKKERRRTQVISLSQPEFDSPKSEKKFKIPAVPPISSSKIRKSTVQAIAGEFEKAHFGFHQKINAASEIEELRKNARLETTVSTEESNFERMDDKEKTFDENQNDCSQGSIQRVSHVEMRPSIQMGIHSFRNYNMIGEDRVWSEHSKNELYSLPIKMKNEKSKNEIKDVERSSRNNMIGKQARQSLPFSDIPEERTYDKIDEIFDFVEKTGDFDKSVERIDGYAEVDHNYENRSSNVKDLSRIDGTYQELDFDKSNTPFVEQFENDGSRFSISSGGPQFTRSPVLMTPHAGQSVTEYRVSEKEGKAKTEKIVVNKSLTPSALATSTPKGTVARNGYSNRHNVEDSFVSSISNMSTADKIHDSRKQITKLIEMIEITKKHINLAEIALLDAKKSRLVVQELSAQRVLLVCRERLKLQLDEVRRLQALSVVRHPPPPLNRHFKSTMVISNIAIQLNKNFNCRGSFAFIVALKCRTEIEATGVVTLMAHYQTRLNVIHFGEHLHFSNLPVDFVITMEVYMMRVPEYKAPEKTCVSVLAAKCKNLLVPNAAHRRPKLRTGNRTSLSLPGTYQSPECEFKFCGKLTLDRDSAGDRHFYLDDITYPLEGTVKLLSHCSSLPEAIDVEYRGFLHMYNEKTSNGEPGWERYWAMLNRGIVFFWKQPSDEKAEQIPLSQIDLTKCTNQSIEELKNEKNGITNIFQIELLIDQTPSLLEKRRVLLAAESGDHLTSWLNALNDTLLALRS